MPTIYDIAKRAGVSAATVSRVFNGRPDVSPRTREKIERIAREMGYQPNAVARGLATKRSMTIGVFFQDHVNSGLRHPFFHDVLAAFKDVVGTYGYDLLFFASNAEDGGPEGFAARARHRDVDGVLLVGVPRTDPALPAMVQSDIPCMSIDLDLLGPRAGYLSSDNIGGARQAVCHLYAKGHRTIGFVGDRYGTKPGHDRLLGYQQTLMELGLPFRQDWILPGDFTEESGYRAGEMYLALEDPPTAVFCAGDMMAIGMMRCLADHGLVVGRDVSIVGFDDIAVARYVTPGLTTIRQNKEEMGTQAAKALVSLIESPQTAPPVLTIATELVERGTVAILR